MPAALNPQQQAVVAHGDAPLLVLAGAGTGKTMVMAHRAAELLRRGIPPWRLLLLTFTRKAAEELRRRATGVAGDHAVELPWCGTFHSIAARLLRRHGPQIGLDRAFSILDETDARIIAGDVVTIEVEGAETANSDEAEGER